jgi:hypothetical protein
MDVFKDVFIVDFSRSGLIAARVVPDLEIGYFVPTLLNIWNEVSFLNLLVVNIK